MGIEIDVLLFGPLALRVGADRLVVAVEESPVTAGQLLERATQSQPAWAEAIRHCRVAVNHAYADVNQLIGPGDEVALIGQVSGG